MSSGTSETMTSAESQQLIARHHAVQGRRYAKAVGLILLSMVFGAIIGVGGAVLYFDRKLHRVPPQPEAIADAIMARLHKLMPLDPEEDASLTAKIQERMDEVESIRRTSFESIRDVFRSMDDDITAVVGPERADKWKEYKRKRKEDRPPRHERHDRHGKRRQ